VQTRERNRALARRQCPNRARSPLIERHQGQWACSPRPGSPRCRARFPGSPPQGPPVLTSRRSPVRAGHRPLSVCSEFAFESGLSGAGAYKTGTRSPRAMRICSSAERRSIPRECSSKTSGRESGSGQPGGHAPSPAPGPPVRAQLSRSRSTFDRWSRRFSTTIETSRSRYPWSSNKTVT